MPGRVPAAGGGDVRRFRGVHEVPRGEDPGNGCLQRGVHGRPAGARVELGSRQPRQLMVGDPVAGEDDRVAADEPGAAGAQIGQLDPLQPVAAGYPAHRRRRPDRGPPAGRGGERERGEALVPWLVGDQREDIGARVRERDHRREAHMLRADDQGAAGQPLPVEVDPLLQLPGGHHAGRPAAGDEPGGARPLPAAGGEQHRRRGDGLDAIGAGQGDGYGAAGCARADGPGRASEAGAAGRAVRVSRTGGPSVAARVSRAGAPGVAARVCGAGSAGGAAGACPPGPAGDRGSSAYLGAGLDGGPRIVPGVGRPGHDPAQVAQPIAGVRAVPRDAAGLGFPVRDEDPAHPEPPQLDPGGQARRARPRDQHVDVHASRPSSGDVCPAAGPAGPGPPARPPPAGPWAAAIIADTVAAQ